MGRVTMKPKNNRDRGKRTETAVAKRMNGVRHGIMGGEDISHPLFSIEVKSRLRFAGTSFMDQAVRNTPEGKTPLVVVHVVGSRHDDDLVMMRLKDWIDFYGNLEGRETE